MKRILSAAAALALVGAMLPMFAAPALAAGEVECLDVGKISRVTGKAMAVPSVGISAVKAQFLPSSSVMPGNCIGIDVGSQTSYWVAVQPFSGSGDIVQLGQMKCKDGGLIYPGPNPCEPSKTNTWRYFYALAGCAGSWEWPHDLGPATSGSHSYQIGFDHTNINFVIDGKSKLKVSSDDMECWTGNIYDDTFGLVASETWDRGDGSGGTSTNKLQSDAWVRNYSTSAWDAHLYYSTTCSQVPYYAYRCTSPDGGSTGGNTVTFWTAR